ncbi:3-ketoacyl-ACP reductase FabG2 [Enterobacter hormaechei]
MIYLSAVGMVNALGNSADEIAANLIAGVAPGMRQRAGWLQGLPEAVLGGVEGELPPVPGSFSAHRSRNNQLLLAALAQIRPAVDAAIARVGRDRVAVVLGTSTSGLDEGDEYVRRAQNGESSPQWQYPQQELGDPSRFLARWLALDGPAYTISTACSSSARAIVSGRRLIDAGLVDVAIVGVHYHRDEAGAQETLEAIVQAGGAGRLLTFDVGNREQCRTVLEQEIADHGAWYGVVSNAGITRDGAFPALSDDDWDSVIHTNLDSFYNVIHPCIMPMIGTRKGGRIITLSSVSGIMGNRGQVNYSAAKAGIIGATKALATELAKRKITVNCIAPGLIDTGMIEMDEAALHAAMSMIPMQRMGQAEEVAGLASYLMSDKAGYVTRQVISINGGML